jgi:hypothetical protein
VPRGRNSITRTVAVIAAAAGVGLFAAGPVSASPCHWGHCRGFMTGRAPRFIGREDRVYAPPSSEPRPDFAVQYGYVAGPASGSLGAMLQGSGRASMMRIRRRLGASCYHSRRASWRALLGFATVISMVATVQGEARSKHYYRPRADEYPSREYYQVQPPCMSLDDCDRKAYGESGTRGRLGLGADPAHPEGPGNPSY